MDQPTTQTLQWQGEHFDTLESATLVKGRNIQVTGIIAGTAGARYVQLSYQLLLNTAWEIQSFSIRSETASYYTLSMQRSADHDWHLDSGEILATLAGCTDIDLSGSAFTNSLPINRPGFPVAGIREISVIYIDILTGQWKPVRQRYTRTGEDTYLYENMDSGFRSRISTDGNGYVLNYPGIWHRVNRVPTLAAAAGKAFAQRVVSVKRHTRYPAPDLFGKIIGSWDVRALTYLEDGFREIQGEWHFAYTLEGRAVQDVWIAPKIRDRTDDTPRQDNRYGTSLRVYDETKGSWYTYWFNPVTGEADILSARMQGSDIVQEGSAPGGALIRWCFLDIQPDSFRWTGELSLDKGKSWRLENEFFALRLP